MNGERKDDVGTICRCWWAELTNRDIGRARADLARLKRAPGVAEALAVQAVHDLNRRLVKVKRGLRHRPERLALIAMTLAQVKEHTRLSLAHRMGQGEPKPLSEIRFTALIQTREAADLVAPLRRALAATGQGADVALLARDLFHWNDDTRAEWCFDYYGAPDAAPDADRNTEETEA